VRAEDPTQPETWRVRFRARLREFTRRQRSAQTAGLCPTPPCARDSTNLATRARKLAHRLEALRRAIADPRRAIAALARRLRALGENARAAARAIALFRPRRARSSMALAHAIVSASDASAGFDDSS
jgi:hypothetical protein